jgi:hypothetical protein
LNLLDYLNARAIRNANIDLLIGQTQRSISRWTLAIIAGVLAALFLPPKIDSVIEKLLFVVLGALMSNWATQNGFWYGRPRAAGVPNPSLTEVKSTETKTIETKSIPAAIPVINPESPHDTP